jgi:hypothetical protein
MVTAGAQPSSVTERVAPILQIEMGRRRALERGRGDECGVERGWRIDTVSAASVASSRGVFVTPRLRHRAA